MMSLMRDEMNMSLEGEKITSLIFNANLRSFG